MHHQHGYREGLSKLFGLLIGCAIGERSINDDAQSKFQLFAREREHKLIGETTYGGWVAQNVNPHLAYNVSVNEWCVQGRGNSPRNCTFAGTRIAAHDNQCTNTMHSRSL